MDENLTKNSSGFYRVDPNGDFQHAPNFVRAPDYELDRELHQTYTYPTEGGWCWFDDTATARDFFGVPEVENA